MRLHISLLDRIQRTRRAESRELRARDEVKRIARFTELNEAVQSLICEEREDDSERAELFDKLLELINPDTAPDDFAERPIHAQVLEIAAALGLDPDLAAQWRDLPPVSDYLGFRSGRIEPDFAAAAAVNPAARTPARQDSS